MKKIVATMTVASALFASPIVSNAALGDQTLRTGMKNNDVKELQQVLKQKGYFKNGTTTTYFGSATKQAVVNFQKANRLATDGVVGPATWKALGSSGSASTSSKPSTSSTTTTSGASKLINTGKKYMGVKYVWGGTTPSGFDCSGFLDYVYKEALGVKLPRTVAEIYKVGVSVKTPSVGDLVFFETYKPGASHAGIYLGNGKFLHSSSSKGVGITEMSNSYWSQRYIGAKRINY
ncbi:C40 family peptidase [Priestia aryabhattai]